jgi:hypothetical protein
MPRWTCAHPDGAEGVNSPNQAKAASETVKTSTAATATANLRRMLMANAPDQARRGNGFGLSTET